MLSLTIIILALVFGVVVDASGGEVASPSPAAIGTASAIKTNTGGSAPWGFILAIGAAIAIFVVGGLFVAMRARREYLDEQRRKASVPKDDT